MADFLSPENRVTEQRKGPVTITSSPNGSVGAFLVRARKGHRVPVLVQSETDYQAIFGDPITDGYGYEAVRGFFKNEGARAWISRAMHYTDIADATTYDAVAGSLQLVDGTPSNTILVEASSPGAWSLDYKITTLRKTTRLTTTAETLTAGASVSSVLLTSSSRVRVGDLLLLTGVATMRVTVTSINGSRVYFAAETVPVGSVASGSPVDLLTFDLTVLKPNNEIERVYSDLRMSSLSTRYFLNVINNSYRTQITVSDDASASDDPRPANVTGSIISGGSDGTAPNTTDYIGSSVSKTGIYAFDRVKGFGTLAVPGIADTTLVQALIDYAESRKRFLALCDIPEGTLPSGIATHVNTTINRFSSYAAFIYPWVKVLDAAGTGAKVTIPASGHWAGIMSRVHQRRGAWKAPAGPEDGALRGVIEPELEVSKEDYDIIYPYKVNAIQSVTGYGVCVMGNITLDPTGEFGEIGIRRSFLHVALSIEEGTRWVQFEDLVPNTFKKMTRACRTFLRRYWKDGGAYGAREEEAFFVQCNEDNNGPLERETRKLRTRIGLAAVHAGEFIDTTLEQDTRAVDAALASST